MDKRLFKNRIKAIVKKAFGKRGLNHLKITESDTHLYTNIYNFNGFFVCLFATEKYDIRVLFFNNRTQEMDIRWMLDDRAVKKNSESYFTESIGERILSLEYYPSMISDFYKWANYIFTHLDISEKGQKGFYNEYKFKINGCTIATRDFVVDVDVLMEKNLHDLVAQINQFKMIMIDGYINLR